MSVYYDLGAYSRTVTTKSEVAQRWFDRGLMWLCGYNHGEAVKCFRRAADHDPACIMAHWGIAYGVGCNYNKKWSVFTPENVAKTMETARGAILAGYRYLASVTPVEAALIQAVEKRFQREGEHPEEVLEAWNGEYAAAMRAVYRRFPDDWDVAALFAEALINRTPWQLWDLPTRQAAAGADTVEAIDVLERALAQVAATGVDPHPGLLHIYIHVMEMSPHPERALRAVFQVAAAAVPDTRYIFNNTCIDILKVAEAMMNGEVAYHQGNYDDAYAELRRAVYLDDNLAYAEPWGWMMPTHHALGALLLEQGHVEEAPAVYRADLGLDQPIYRPMQHPDNVWALHGYVSCLQQQGKTAEATMMQGRLDQALARADVTITAS